MSWEWQSLDNDVMNIWQDGTGIHLQLYRWDDECYFNIDTPWAVPSLGDLIEVQDGLLRMSFGVGNKIEFERKSAEEVEEGFIQNERGGIEIYIVANARPVSNVMEFPISHQGLEFLYQSPGGEHTPEKVIGSYAVYHATRGVTRGETVKRVARVRWDRVKWILNVKQVVGAVVQFLDCSQEASALPKLYSTHVRRNGWRHGAGINYVCGESFSRGGR